MKRERIYLVNCPALNAKNTDELTNIFVFLGGMYVHFLRQAGQILKLIHIS